MTSGGSSENYETERTLMVENQLRQRGIEDERVLEAFDTVPRHEFVNPEQRNFAYEDRALPTSAGQTISQPYMVATMTESLAVKPGQRVLEIGTGSGYQTAILLELDAEVYTVEKVSRLSERARKTLDRIGYDKNVHFRVGDGTKGWPEHAPFDRILVTAGAPELPATFKEQSASSARIVIPEGTKNKQTLTVYHRRNGGPWERTASTSCVFVPLTGERGWDARD